MTEANENLEFNVLGFNVRFKGEDENPSNVNPVDVVKLVEAEVDNLRSSMPNLDNSKAAILVALKMASDKLAIESEYKETLDKLQDSANFALNVIEELSPAH